MVLVGGSRVLLGVVVARVKIAVGETGVLDGEVGLGWEMLMVVADG